MEAAVTTSLDHKGNLERVLQTDPDTLSAADVLSAVSAIDFATKQLRSQVECGLKGIRQEVIALLQRSITFIEQLEARFEDHHISAVKSAVGDRLSVIMPKEQTVG
jgi:hypothetical protein